MEEQEIWKDIPGFEGYQVSNMGRIKTLRRRHAKILKLSDKSYVILYRLNSTVPVINKIRVLVAEAFLPNPNHLPYVRNLDGNLRNNKVTNLEWSNDNRAPSSSQTSKRNFRLSAQAKEDTMSMPDELLKKCHEYAMDCLHYFGGICWNGFSGITCLCLRNRKCKAFTLDVKRARKREHNKNYLKRKQQKENDKNG